MKTTISFKWDPRNDFRCVCSYRDPAVPNSGWYVGVQGSVLVCGVGRPLDGNEVREPISVPNEDMVVEVEYDYHAKNLIVNTGFVSTGLWFGWLDVEDGLSLCAGSDPHLPGADYPSAVVAQPVSG